MAEDEGAGRGGHRRTLAVRSHSGRTCYDRADGDHGCPHPDDRQGQRRHPLRRLPRGHLGYPVADQPPRHRVAGGRGVMDGSSGDQPGPLPVPPGPESRSTLDGRQGVPVLPPRRGPGADAAGRRSRATIPAGACATASIARLTSSSRPDRVPNESPRSMSLTILLPALTALLPLVFSVPCSTSGASDARPTSSSGRSGMLFFGIAAGCEAWRRRVRLERAALPDLVPDRCRLDGRLARPRDGVPARTDAVRLHLRVLPVPGRSVHLPDPAPRTTIRGPGPPRSCTSSPRSSWPSRSASRRTSRTTAGRTWPRSPWSAPRC